MYDILPFPNIVAGSVEEQTAQTNNYLIQLKETLEFVLTNISTENLSQDLIAKLNSMGVETTSEENFEQIQQISGNMLTISDVINSNAFNLALESKLKFNVNFENGELEYTVL
jgi:hypothetical protein